MTRILVHGLATGMILQIAIGPVFFFITNLALQKTLYDGLIAVAGVTFADYIFIMLAIFGVGKLLERKNVKRLLALVSSVVLALFGIWMITQLPAGVPVSGDGHGAAGTLSASFIQAFILTISSPLAIIFWTGLFTVKAMERNYARKEVLIFGLAAGFSTVLFLSTAVLIMTGLKASIPLSLIKILNLGVGMLLVAYGCLRFINTLKVKER